MTMSKGRATYLMPVRPTKKLSEGMQLLHPEALAKYVKHRLRFKSVTFDSAPELPGMEWI
jgi:hypothetical protein